MKERNKVAEKKHRSLRGMSDIYSDEAATMRWVEEKARYVFGIFGYDEIRTPLLEETEVFTRSIGEDTDIVEKEMYSFTDRGGKNVSLRPEGTAAIIRACIEHGFCNAADVVKLYYMGPMFRGERPQKGRLRQFHQIGAEIIGGIDPYIDAEIIFNLTVLLQEMNVSGFSVLLNSLGCGKDRVAYKKTLVEYLSGKSDGLCEDCKRRTGTNVLRVLDCKKEACRDIAGKAPGILDSLCLECTEYYDKLKNILSKMKVPFKEKPDLVRGLDYYTGTIFEVVHTALGAQDAIAAGGRYDGLSAQMGGPDVGATGYAVGIERLLMAIDRSSLDNKRTPALIVCVSEAVRDEAFDATNRLRLEGISCETDLTGRSFKGQMRKAGRENRKHVILIGEDEIKSGKVILKDMEKGEQEELAFEKLVEKLKKEQS